MEYSSLTLSQLVAERKRIAEQNLAELAKIDKHVEEIAKTVDEGVAAMAVAPRRLEFRKAVNNEPAAWYLLSGHDEDETNERDLAPVEEQTQ